LRVVLEADQFVRHHPRDLGKATCVEIVAVRVAPRVAVLVAVDPCRSRLGEIEVAKDAPGRLVWRGDQILVPQVEPSICGQRATGSLCGGDQAVL